MNKKLALIAALAVVGVFAAFVAVSSLSETQFHFKTLRSDTTIEKLFQNWKLQHGKTYGGAEHGMRFKIFSDNYHTIRKINSVPRSFSVGLNQFADLTKAEFANLHLGRISKNVVAKSNELPVKVAVDTVTVDWRKEGIVTPVKNQGQCGGCWAFSVTGSLEGLNAQLNKQLISFSEQQLIDCSSAYGNEGCNGGDQAPTLNYTSTYGVETEDDYPFTAQDGTCQYDKSKVVFTNGGFGVANSDSDLEKAVSKQPVSVSVEADQSVFQFYTSGILDSDECGTDLDHAILAVGYGKKGDTGYWIVKNSWGESWGENGYINIARKTGDGVCGINMDNSYPTA